MDEVAMERMLEPPPSKKILSAQEVVEDREYMQARKDALTIIKEEKDSRMSNNKWV